MAEQAGTPIDRRMLRKARLGKASEHKGVAGALQPLLFCSPQIGHLQQLSCVLAYCDWQQYYTAYSTQPEGVSAPSWVAAWQRTKCAHARHPGLKLHARALQRMQQGI